MAWNMYAVYGYAHDTEIIRNTILWSQFNNCTLLNLRLHSHVGYVHWSMVKATYKTHIGAICDYFLKLGLEVSFSGLFFPSSSQCISSNKVFWKSVWKGFQHSLLTRTGTLLHKIITSHKYTYTISSHNKLRYCERSKFYSIPLIHFNDNIRFRKVTTSSPKCSRKRLAFFSFFF